MSSAALTSPPAGPHAACNSPRPAPRRPCGPRRTAHARHRAVPAADDGSGTRRPDSAAPPGTRRSREHCGSGDGGRIALDREWIELFEADQAMSRMSSARRFSSSRKTPCRCRTPRVGRSWHRYRRSLATAHRTRARHPAPPCSRRPGDDATDSSASSPPAACGSCDASGGATDGRSAPVWTARRPAYCSPRRAAGNAPAAPRNAPAPALHTRAATAASRHRPDPIWTRPN